MAETIAEETNNEAQPSDSESQHRSPTRLQSFVINHPRAAKVVAVTGAITAVAGAVAVTRNLRANRNELDSAAEHAELALSDLSSSVSPTDTEA
jgi:hypothetical protein